MSLRSYFDVAWKELLERHLPQLVLLLFPDLYEAIDWTREWESLEQELRQLFPDSRSGYRLADKLVKVHYKSGDFDHLRFEVQARAEGDFGYRVHDYFAQDGLHFGLPPETLVLLADGDPAWRPTSYVVRLR